MLRKQGLGASDSSIFLGTMAKFSKGIDDLITDKLTLKYTEADAKISDLPSVRMGRDLEDIVLAKAAVLLETEIVKAPQMFRMINYPHLTMNLDGVMSRPWPGTDPMVQTVFIPVEAKVVTTYGDKYYNWDKSTKLFAAPDISVPVSPCSMEVMVDYIEKLAAETGLPPYYYVQVQHELLGMGAPVGYLVALRMKDWTVYPFAVTANPQVQQWIILEGHKVWQKIEKLRGLGHRQ